MRNRDLWSAEERGDIIIQGLLLEGLISLFSGFGNFGDPSFGPHYNQLLENHEALIKCMEVAESRGFARDLCSSMRCHLGQLYMDITTASPRGGTAHPHFVFQSYDCPSMAKTGQLYAEHLGIPFITVDVPFRDSAHTRAYFVQRLLDVIEWTEKHTGKTCDDEALVQGVSNEWECFVLWARLCEQQKAIPAPMDMRHLQSLRVPWANLRHKKEGVEFYRMVLDEVKERVAQGISARGYETARFLHEGIPPFFYIQLLKMPTEYGAVFLGGNTFDGGAWVKHEDGTWESAQTLQEQGRELRTREQAMDALADLYLNYRPHMCYTAHRPQAHLKRVWDYASDGVVVHLDHGCNGIQTGMMEVKRVLQENGVPTTTYEGSQCDPRDFSEAQVRDRLESFFESLGLTKVADEAEGEGE
jgi:benzoyl-CoA reductase subunit B